MDQFQGLREDIQRTEATFQPRDVGRWNATSWAGLAAIVAGSWPVDHGWGQATEQDRAVAARLTRKALAAEAGRRRGLLGRLLGGAPPDPVQWAKGLTLSRPRPPEPLGTFQGAAVSRAQFDPHRLERHVVLAALALERYEADPTWRPTQTEVQEAARALGIGG